MSKNGKVLVAMSGGVDSSVVAMMLHEQGYEVIGITMKVWDYASTGGSTRETGCCSLDSINDARDMAVQMGFPHYILDLRAEFNTHVITNFVSEYMAGRTPNPCVLCNTFIKWDALLRKADQLNCSHIVTGHYATVNQLNGRYYITKGLDEDKDQSYVLWGLTQANLSRTLFPLGGMTKAEVKKMALDSGFPNLAKKSESYEICFIPDNDYRNFLRHKVENLSQLAPEGNFVDKNGKILGRHKGYPFYTIGQRKGLEIALGVPAYVSAIRPETNEVVVGFKEDLMSDNMAVHQLNMMKYERIPQDLKPLVKIRYKDKGILCSVTEHNDVLQVGFDDPVSAVTSGQSAVFYEGNDLLGGGVII